MCYRAGLSNLMFCHRVRTHQNATKGYQSGQTAEEYPIPQPEIVIRNDRFAAPAVEGSDWG
jgi:hypothetical protein